MQNINYARNNDMLPVMSLYMNYNLQYLIFYTNIYINHDCKINLTIDLVKL